MVLLVMDTQKLITTPELFGFNTFVSNVKQLIQTARENKIEVIYIRHDDGEEDGLMKGTEGFEIYEEFKPLDGERIFDKHFNSAFRDTGLLEYLQEKHENQVIVTGLMTDYCIDATIKCGFEHKLDIIVPAYTNTTESNSYLSGKASYHYYNDEMWKDRYAECISMEETIKRMTGEVSAF